MESTMVGSVIAVCTFALGMIGGMVHIVWVLSRMRTQLDRVITDIECGYESQEDTATTLRLHGERITRLEACHP